MTKRTVYILFIIAIAQSGIASDRVPVFVSIPPQKYFVQQIGKDLVDVKVMVQPGANPATYEPKPRQLADLSKTKAYFSIGVPFENTWLKKIAAANPKMRVVHTDHGIEKTPMATSHRHNEEGEYDHGGRDPHIWLSPSLVKIQARTIWATLQKIDPSRQAIYDANYKRFVSGIDELDTELKAMFSDKQGLRFMVFHPAWGYFAQAYGLKQVPIELEGKNPKPAQLKELIEHARKNKITVIFVQPQFSTKNAKLVAREISGQVVFANPLAEDWMTNLRKVADKFKNALK